MKIDIDTSEALFVEHGEAIEEILRHAVRQALLAHKHAGNSIAVWDGEKVVLISPDQILVADPAETVPS